MTQSQKAVKQYLRKLSRELAVPKKMKRQFLNHFKEELDGYIMEKGMEVDYERLKAYFGSPAMVAQDYAVAWETEFGATAMQNKYLQNIVRGICVMVLIVCFILLAYSTIYAVSIICGYYMQFY